MDKFLDKFSEFLRDLTFDKAKLKLYLTEFRLNNPDLFETFVRVVNRVKNSKKLQKEKRVIEKENHKIDSFF